MTQLSIETPVFQSAPHLAPENHPDEIAQLLTRIRKIGTVSFQRMPRAYGLSDEDCDTYWIKGIPVRAVRQWSAWYRDDAGNPVEGWRVRYDVLCYDHAESNDGY